MILTKVNTFKDPNRLDANKLEHIKYSTLGKKN